MCYLKNSEVNIHTHTTQLIKQTISGAFEAPVDVSAVASPIVLNSGLLDPQSLAPKPHHLYHSALTRSLNIC